MMTLDGDQDKKTKEVVENMTPLPLVGHSGAVEDSDSDSEPAEDIDDYELEDQDDPVCFCSNG